MSTATVIAKSCGTHPFRLDRKDDVLPMLTFFLESVDPSSPLER